MKTYLSLALTLVLLAGLTTASPRNSPRDRNIARRTVTRTVTQSPPPNFDYTFQYTSFSGAVYTRRGYDGLHVRYALPDSWITSNAFTPLQIRKLIDITDIYYEKFSEIVQGDPQGD